MDKYKGLLKNSVFPRPFEAQSLRSMPVIPCCSTIIQEQPCKHVFWIYALAGLFVSDPYWSLPQWLGQKSRLGYSVLWTKLLAGQEAVSQGACFAALSQQGCWVGPHACFRPSISFPHPSFVVFLLYFLPPPPPKSTSRNSLNLYRFWSALSTFLLQPPRPMVLSSFVTASPA